MFPKDDEDEPENWVDKDLLSEEEIIRNMILENKLFSITPKLVKLEPGHSSDVTFVYHHKFATAAFELPVVLQLKPEGKQVVLLLRGQTLHVGEHYLHTPTPYALSLGHGVAGGPSGGAEASGFLGLRTGEYPLRAVALGETDPPVQVTEITNGGKMAIEYELDTDELEALNTANYDFDVLRLISAPTGSLYPGETAQLRWMFKPLEAKRYCVRIPVNIVGGDPSSLTLWGEGFHPVKNEVPSPDIVPVPTKQLLLGDEQPVVLSTQRIVEDSVPTGAKVHRLVTLMNLSDKPHRFSWDLSSDIASDVLTIIPQSGSIPAGEQQMCRVIVCAYKAPISFDIAVPVAIEEDKPEEPEEENLDDMAGDADKGKTADNASVRSAATGGGTVGGGARKNVRKSVINRMPKHKIPFIKEKQETVRLRRSMQNADDDMISNDADTRSVGGSSAGFGARASTASTSSSPQRGMAGTMPGSDEVEEGEEDPDYTLYLCVAVNARTPLRQQEVVKDIDKFYIPRVIPAATKPAAASVEAELGVGVQSILSQLLREAVSDEGVSGTFEDLGDRRVPLFVQVAARPPTPFQLPFTPRGSSVAGGRALSSEEEQARQQEEQDDVERQRRMVLALPEFENAAYLAFSGCLMNLLEEVLHGEEELDSIA